MRILDLRGEKVLINMPGTVAHELVGTCVRFRNDVGKYLVSFTSPWQGNFTAKQMIRLNPEVCRVFEYKGYNVVNFGSNYTAYKFGFGRWYHANTPLEAIQQIDKALAETSDESESS